MAVFYVNVRDFQINGVTRRYINIETEHETVDELAAALRNGPIVCDRLIVRRVGNELEVLDRRRMMLNGDYVMTAEAPELRFFEAVPEERT